MRTLTILALQILSATCFANSHEEVRGLFQGLRAQEAGIDLFLNGENSDEPVSDSARKVAQLLTGCISDIRYVDDQHTFIEIAGDECAVDFHLANESLWQDLQINNQSISGLEIRGEVLARFVGLTDVRANEKVLADIEVVDDEIRITKAIFTQTIVAQSLSGQRYDVDISAMNIEDQAMQTLVVKVTNSQMTFFGEYSRSGTTEECKIDDQIVGCNELNYVLGAEEYEAVVDLYGHGFLFWQ